MSFLKKSTVLSIVLVGVSAAIFLTWRWWTRPNLPIWHSRSAIANGLDSRLSVAHELLERAGSTNLLSGRVVVSGRDRVLIARSFGYADREAGLPWTDATPSLIGSLTKQFTAFLIRDYSDRQQIGLDVPVCRYLNNFCSGDAATIKVTDLLTHTSGIRRDRLPLWKIISFAVDEVTEPMESALSAVLSSDPNPLLFRPGSDQRYSNFGYEALGAVLERVAGESFPVLFEKRIRHGFRLQNTRVLADTNDRSLARPYELKRPHPWAAANHRPLREFEDNYSSFFGAGAGVSSIEDLVRWIWLQKDSGAFDRLPVLDGWDQQSGEVLTSGWVINKSAAGSTLAVWHNGQVPGYYAELAYLPREGLVIVSMFNNDQSEFATRLAKSLRDLFSANSFEEFH